jgi:hypothetical protein
MMRAAHIMLTVSALALGGCQAVAIGVAAPGILKQERVNVTNSSYAAADMLIQQSGNRLKKTMPVMVSEYQELIDLNQEDAKLSPKLGALLREQLETRFAQLGYNIVDPAPAYSSARQSGVEVLGTYKIVKTGFNGSLHVNLKLRDNNQGRIISLYEYSLPMTYDLRRHTPDGDGMLAPLMSSL